MPFSYMPSAIVRREVAMRASLRPEVSRARRSAADRGCVVGLAAPIRDEAAV